MTNRQWLNGLSTEQIVKTLDPMMCPQDDCPEIDCKRCWANWLDEECDKPTSSVYDVVEEHKNCTVQVLKNSVTGEMSVGWKKNE